MSQILSLNESDTISDTVSNHLFEAKVDTTRYIPDTLLIQKRDRIINYSLYSILFINEPQANYYPIHNLPQEVLSY